MVWFVPSLGAVGGFIVRRRVQIVAGTLIVTYLDDAGRMIGRVVGQEAADIAEEELMEAGKTLVDDIGEATLNVIRGAGRAFVDGVDDAYDYIRDRFVLGREPAIVTGVTIGFLTILSVVYLYHSVKNAQDAL